MAGMTQTPDAKTKDTTQYFSQTGVQNAVKGSSIQYNLERSFTLTYLKFQTDIL